MSAPQLSTVVSEHPEPALGSPLHGVASVATVASTLTAISAREASVALPQPTPQIAEFVDELLRYLPSAITVYQRELLTEALTRAMDARIQATRPGPLGSY